MLLLGIAVVVWAWNTPERQRGRTAGRLEIGDDTTRIPELLAERGASCAVGSLEHLQTQLPGDPAPATVESILEWLRRETAERRVVALEGRQSDCRPKRDVTEIGIDRAGRVLWVLPMSRRTPLRLPDEIMAEPAGRTSA